MSLERKGSAWELTVVTLDKPFLFSNISGVLSSFGMDILRGHAMTSPNGLVLDVFQFTDGERFLELNPARATSSSRRSNDVVSGRVDVTVRLRGREQSLFGRRGAAGQTGRATATTTRRAATRSSRSWRTMRWGCCIASAG